MIAPVIMISKAICVSLIFFVVIFAGCGISWAGFTIHSPQAVKINLMGFDGLHQNTLFKGEVSAQGKCEIDVSYRGLALFVFLRYLDIISSHICSGVLPSVKIVTVAKS